MTLRMRNVPTFCTHAVEALNDYLADDAGHGALPTFTGFTLTTSAGGDIKDACTLRAEACDLKAVAAFGVDREEDGGCGLWVGGGEFQDF